MSSNGFAPGQIYPSAIPELLRVLRPGGYLIWTMREGYHHTSQRFALMDNEIQNLQKTGVTPGGGFLQPSTTFDLPEGKGLYPIFAIMSHYCVCNARYYLCDSIPTFF